MSADPVAATTAEALAQLPDDGQRHELVRGELTTMPPAGFQHGQVAALLLLQVAAHVRLRRLGHVLAAETGFRLAREADTVRAPDVAFVAADRPLPTDRRGFLDLSPDLVDEVVSPSDRASDVLEEADAWLAAGTSVVWVVHPAVRRIAVHAPGGHVLHVGDGDVLDGAPDPPGLQLPVASPFED